MAGNSIGLSPWQILPIVHTGLVFWVIQEFLLGRDVQLYCSGNRIDWLLFQDILGRETNVNFLSSEGLQRH